jgi:hypothetical protein
LRITHAPSLYETFTSKESIAASAIDTRNHCIPHAGPYGLAILVVVGLSAGRARRFLESEHLSTDAAKRFEEAQHRFAGRERRCVERAHRFADLGERFGASPYHSSSSGE